MKETRRKKVLFLITKSNCRAEKPWGGFSEIRPNFSILVTLAI